MSQAPDGPNRSADDQPTHPMGLSLLVMGGITLLIVLLAAVTAL
ncbi:MAG: hypothetical protein R2754_12385 [Microthrixaceae bacterium]